MSSECEVCGNHPTECNCNRTKEVKVTYEFQLPSHLDQLRIFQNAQDYHSLLWDIDEECRAFIKYDNEKFKTPQDLAIHIRKMISETEFLY